MITLLLERGFFNTFSFFYNTTDMNKCSLYNNNTSPYLVENWHYNLKVIGIIDIFRVRTEACCQHCALLSNVRKPTI